MKSLIHRYILDELKAMARSAPKDGVIIEVGVYQGGSALELMQVAKEKGQELWLFDTFSGMPEAGPQDFHKVGDFSSCSLEAVRTILPDAKIFPGFFPGTWHPIEPKPRISFAHVDCDQYESISQCIKIFKPLMVPGGIIWFDDYGYAWLPGAQKAVDDNLPERTIHKYGRAYWRAPC